MIVHPSIEGFEGQNFEVKTSPFGGAKLFVNGQPAPKGSAPRSMSLTRNDGRVVTAQWRSQLFGFDLPQLEVDGKLYPLSEPLKWYAVAISALPLFLVFIGGLLGALAGVVAFAINSSIFRSGTNKVVQVLLAILVTLGAVLLYLVLATLLLSVTGG